MSHWEFEINQQVICINDKFNFSSGEITPKEGSIYTVRDLEMVGPDLCLRVMEIRNAERPYGGVEFCECWFIAQLHFRPVKKTDISDLKSLLNRKYTPDEIHHFTQDMYELEKV